MSLTAQLASALDVEWRPPPPDPYADTPLTAAVAASLASSIPNDLTEWCDNNGLQLWSKQREIVRSINEHRYTSVRSCNSSGKTALSASAALHFALTRQKQDAIVVVLSSGWDNIRTGIHRRIAELIADWDLPGRLIDKRYTINGKELITFRSPPKGSVSTKRLLQGIHAQYMLVIVDEANEIPAGLWAEMLSIATGMNIVILALGNPTAAGTPFERTFQPDSGWNNIHVSWDDIRHARANEDLTQRALESLLDEMTVEQMRGSLAEYEIAARIDGEFPTESQLAFYNMTNIDIAMGLTNA